MDLLFWSDVWEFGDWIVWEEETEAEEKEESVWISVVVELQHYMKV